MVVPAGVARVVLARGTGVGRVTVGRQPLRGDRHPGSHRQFYSGNLMRPTTGKGGAHYARRSGVCLEPQAYPDALHQPSFPSIVLRPDEVDRAGSVFRLRVDGPS
jgi:galactose mutarotase-like enzyme